MSRPARPRPDPSGLDPEAVAVVAQVLRLYIDRPLTLEQAATGLVAALREVGWEVVRVDPPDA